MCCHGRWWVSSVLSWSSVPGHAWIEPLNRESVAQHVCGPACRMNAELGSGIIRDFEGPELAGTPAQHTCSHHEQVHDPCRRSSKLGFWFVAPVCAGRVLAEKWKPSLAEALSLGLGMGLGAELGWEPLGVVKQRKTPRQRDHGAGLTAKP